MNITDRTNNVSVCLESPFSGETCFHDNALCALCATIHNTNNDGCDSFRFSNMTSTNINMDVVYSRMNVRGIEFVTNKVVESIWYK